LLEKVSSRTAAIEPALHSEEAIVVELGAVSISLTVKDTGAPRAFDELLGLAAPGHLVVEDPDGNRLLFDQHA
jgi:hypothetical protein